MQPEISSKFDWVVLAQDMHKHMSIYVSGAGDEPEFAQDMHKHMSIYVSGLGDEPEACFFLP